MGKAKVKCRTGRQQRSTLLLSLQNLLRELCSSTTKLAVGKAVTAHTLDSAFAR